MKYYANKVTHRTLYLIVLCLFVLPFNNNCKKITNNTPVPVITTLSTVDITPESAVIGFSILSEGASEIFETGFCWSLYPSPDLSDNVAKGFPRLGSFSFMLKNLQPETLYYVRAYAINHSGIGFGNTINFTTLSYLLPIVITEPVMQIEQTKCKSGGTIISTGGTPILEAGICYSMETLPDINDQTTTDTILENDYTSYLSRLKPNTTYYLRAFATNRKGTGYGNVRIIKTTEVDSSVVVDNDYNIYSVVKIGTQQWMGENLKVTTYKDGTPLNLMNDKQTWLTNEAPSYCWYNNDATIDKNLHGALYNWYTVTGENLCPTGWHIPSVDEWELLRTYLGGNSAGGKMKMTGITEWLSPNLGATNESGFNGYPSGIRNIYGDFVYKKYSAYYWSNTEKSEGFGWSFTLNSSRVELSKILSTAHEGLSIRCVKDE